ncbi:MAG: hypothetical protein ACHQ6U_02455 [Thermodesulfobacteriota bacterium]
MKKKSLWEVNILSIHSVIHSRTWIFSDHDDRIITQKRTEEYIRASSFLVVLLFTFCLIYAGCEKSDNKSENGQKTSTGEKLGKDVTKTADKVGDEAKEAVEDVAKKSEEMHEAQLGELRKIAPADVAPEFWNLIHTEEYQHWKSMPGTEKLNKDAAQKKT